MEASIQKNDFFLLIGTGILAMLLFAIGLIIVFYTSQRKLLNEKMQQQKLQLEHQQELLFSSIKTQEKERKRIAKDLHDEIGSKLNVVLMNLRFLGRQPTDAEQLKETIIDVENLLGTTIDSTRRISHDLLPPILDDFGLVAAIKELQDAYQHTELTFDLDATQAGERLEDKFIELNLFRVIQELLKNSIAHGKATHMHMQIITEPLAFTIIYKDNGKGLELSRLEEQKGLGTQSIESRLNMCGANISYESEIGQGIKVVITKTATALS